MAVNDGDFRFNQSRVEEHSNSPDIQALATGGKLPNTSISQLTDVGGPTPLNNQALAWSDLEGKYVPTTFMGPGSGLLQPDENYIVDAAIESSQQFALFNVPAIGTLMVAVNGVVQRFGTDYTLTVNLVSFTSATVAQGDTLWTKYQ